jgi:hypothetical protein
MEGSLNSLIYDYLSTVGSKSAEKFKKEFKPKALPVGSPSLKEIFSNHLNGLKRKPSLEAAPVVKKNKKVNYNSVGSYRTVTELVQYRINNRIRRCCGSR